MRSTARQLQIIDIIHPTDMHAMRSHRQHQQASAPLVSGVKHLLPCLIMPWQDYHRVQRQQCTKHLPSVCQMSTATCRRHNAGRLCPHNSAHARQYSSLLAASVLITCQLDCGRVPCNVRRIIVLACVYGCALSKHFPLHTVVPTSHSGTSSLRIQTCYHNTVLS